MRAKMRIDLPVCEASEYKYRYDGNCTKPEQFRRTYKQLKQSGIWFIMSHELERKMSRTSQIERTYGVKLIRENWDGFLNYSIVFPDDEITCAWLLTLDEVEEFRKTELQRKDRKPKEY